MLLSFEALGSVAFWKLFITFGCELLIVLRVAWNSLFVRLCLHFLNGIKGLF